jgi:hypothetical protein
MNGGSDWAQSGQCGTDRIFMGIFQISIFQEKRASRQAAPFCLLQLNSGSLPVNS